MVARLVLALLLCAVVVLASARADACSICSSGDPLLSARDAAGDAGGLRLDLGSGIASAWAQSEEDAGETESVTQVTIAATAAFSPMERLGFVVHLPVVLKFLGERDAAGLGDLDVAARVLALRHVDFQSRSRHTVSASVGLSLPTGANDKDAGGVRLDEHAQPGTGAFGGWLGAQYRYERDPFSAYVGVAGRGWTTNAFGYRHGPALQWTALAQVRPIERLALEAGVDGRYAARDVSQDELQANTGGLVLALSPGMLLRLVGELWVTARVQVPVFAHLFGVQGVGPTVQFGLQWRAL
ncbi:MAG: hypothetical protein QM765_43460 [Myxococcales bacterium]